MSYIVTHLCGNFGVLTFTVNKRPEGTMYVPKFVIGPHLTNT